MGVVFEKKEILKMKILFFLLFDFIFSKGFQFYSLNDLLDNYRTLANKYSTRVSISDENPEDKNQD